MPTDKEEYRQYGEDIALELERGGFARSAGRVLGWLTISDPPHQTLTDLVEALQISKSFVSIATRTLIQVGLVQRISISGHRRDFYMITDGVWQGVLREANRQVTEICKLADRGLKLLSDQPPERHKRLQELRGFYAFFEREIPRLMTRWEQEVKVDWSSS